MDDIPSLIIIQVKKGHGWEGYGPGKYYCPQCSLAFEVDPPKASLLRCPFCHTRLRTHGRRRAEVAGDGNADKAKQA